MSEHRYTAATIRNLRTQTGLSLSRLSNQLQRHINTLKLWEREGTSNDEAVEQLVKLAEQVQTGQLQFEPSVAGRPIGQKDWYIARGHYYRRSSSPTGYVDYSHYSRRLFLPGHHEHLRWIIDVPNLRRCNIGWLVRKFDSNIPSTWREGMYDLHLRDAGGMEHVVPMKPFHFWAEIKQPISELIAQITKS